jgi:Zn-dependent M32 family carboxypeptidase
LVELERAVAGIADEERAYYDNMPESLQSSERGARAEEVAGTLEEVSETISEMIAQLEDCQ